MMMFHQRLPLTLAVLAANFLLATEPARAQSSSQPAAQTAPGEKPLVLDWSQGQPKGLWRKRVGWGYSAAVVQGNRVYSMGYGFITGGHEDTVFCLDAETGKPVWSQRVGMRASGVFIDPKRGEMPTCIGPRAAVVLDGDFLYAVCQDGKVVCFKTANGEQVWLKELDRDPATAKATLRPKWCYAGAPLVLGDMLIVAAGTAGLALDKKTGNLVWTSGPDAAGQASPVHFQQDGKPRLAVFSAEQFYVIDPADGKTLWKMPWPAASFPLAPDPLAVEDRILLCGADRPGAVLVAPGTDKPLWENKDLAPRAATPVFHDGYVYGPNQAAQALVCIDAKDGSTKWTQKLNTSALMLVGDKLVVQSLTGAVTLVEASPKAFRSLGSFKPLDSDDCWTRPTVARVPACGWRSSSAPGKVILWPWTCRPSCRHRTPHVAQSWPRRPADRPALQARRGHRLVQVARGRRRRHLAGNRPEPGLGQDAAETPLPPADRLRLFHRGRRRGPPVHGRLVLAHGQGHRLLPQRQQRRRGVETLVRCECGLLAGRGPREHPAVHGSARHGRLGRAIACIGSPPMARLSVSMPPAAKSSGTVI